MSMSITKSPQHVTLTMIRDRVRDTLGSDADTVIDEITDYLGGLDDRALSHILGSGRHNEDARMSVVWRLAEQMDADGHSNLLVFLRVLYSLIPVPKRSMVGLWARESGNYMCAGATYGEAIEEFVRLYDVEVPEEVEAPEDEDEDEHDREIRQMEIDEAWSRYEQEIEALEMRSITPDMADADGADPDAWHYLSVDEVCTWREAQAAGLTRDDDGRHGYAV